MTGDESPIVVRFSAGALPILPEERALLDAVGIRLAEAEGSTDEEVLEATRDADAMIVASSYVRGPIIAQLNRCRVISRMGIGVDKVDIEMATRKGILVTNLPGFCAEEVADHTMAFLLAVARQLKWYETNMRRGRREMGLEHMHRLSTQTLGIIGFGNIGRAVAARARAFGMEILAYDPVLTEEVAANEGVTAADMDAVLAKADYLCLLCPLLPSTRGMMTLREFRKMKPTAVLVNTARGELIKEDDLVIALREGIIRYAALDVFAGIDMFAPEGFSTDHPFFSLENMLLTPHVASTSQEALFDARVRAVQAVVDVLSGRWPHHPVNPEVVPWFPIALPS